MLFFRKRKNEAALPAQVLAFMETDIHSHLLPGIDDGVPDTATAVYFIEQLQLMGIKKIITTPHIMMDRYPNSAITMATPYQEVLDALTAKNIPIPLYHAAEYYMDEQFEALMQKPLLTLSGNMVLVEISFMSAPPQLHKWLFDLQSAGYQPVLAHPERYAYFHSNADAYRQLKNQGCLLQINLLSLTGYYGKHIQQAAEKMLDTQMADLIGTDLHHEKHLQAIANIATNKKLRKVLEHYPFRNKTL
ncbi:tyrosine-protein phosphatase YwqE [Chitinophaga niastensis]|uniref:protein-tyrosine-phosphatase n=1 Tax=Chitinophaga niastensis TaxID=536980 RepID=A0A2P8HFA6_CHINA|nr:CpsB/CapC family capsule biosynthesis tyrosine phosphatase [Chitinophaga niastensis]PSL44909.1 tyrosine-protein phosphatase YwqE [Chitinophaga niastensis]